MEYHIFSENYDQHFSYLDFQSVFVASVFFQSMFLRSVPGLHYRVIFWGPLSKIVGVKKEDLSQTNILSENLLTEFFNLC